MKKNVLLVLSILLITNSFGQNNISVNVIVNPPYSHDIRDYMSQPGKILVMLMANPSPDLAAGRDVYRFKLIGSITGDNGIFLRTLDAYRPPMPIEMALGESRQLTANDVENYFSSENLEYQGITKRELFSKGLPEGSYTICIQAVDYDTNEPLSEEEPFGCSALFELRYIEPPQLINPICDDEVEIMNPQFISFQWTVPVGILNPSTIRYKFRLYELPNEDSNPESIAYSTSPPFFEQTDIFTTNLIYNAAMPILDTDKKYVWMVIAEDQNEKIQFANNGKSEICTFSFAMEEDVFDNEEIVIISPAWCSKDSALECGTLTDFYVSWQFQSLMNQIADFGPKGDKQSQTLNTILEKYKNARFEVKFYSDKAAKQLIYSASTKNTYFQSNAQKLPFVDGQSYWFQVTLADSISQQSHLISDLCAFKYKWVEEQAPEYVTRTINGRLMYQFQGNESKTFPASNVAIKLVKSYILKDATTGEELEIPENDYEQTSNYQPYNILNLSFDGLASTVTNQNGNFSVQLNLKKDEKLGLLEPNYSYSNNGKSYTGPVSRVIRIIPQNSYYAPVKQGIVPVEETTNLGQLSTYVYSYALNAEISEGYQYSSGVIKPLINKNVYLLRKSKNEYLPKYEGNLNAGSYMMAPSAISNAGFSLVVSGKTKLAKGSDNQDVAIVEFSNLIQNILYGDEYYLWIEGTDIQTSWKVKFNAHDAQPSSQTGAQGMNYTNNTIVGLVSEADNETFSDIKEYSFKVSKQYKTISNEPPKSVVKGKLIYNYPGKASTTRPLANTPISIISCYVTGPEGYSKIVKTNKYEEYEDAYPGAQVLGTSVTNASGEFEFEFSNIPVQNFFNTVGQYEVTTGNLNRTHTWEAWESSGGGDFRLLYETKTATIRRVFRIVVEDPNGLYMSPDKDFIIEPLKSKDVGTLTSNVFTYKLTGEISHTTTSYSNNSVGFETEKIPGVECYLLRKKSDIENANFPEGEGQNIIGSLDEYPDFKVVNFDTTDAQGAFEFDNILFRNANAPIYRFFRTPEMKGTYNYEPKLMTHSTINPFVKPRFFFNSDYRYTTISGAGAQLEPAKPGVRGKVISNVNAQKGIKDAHCSLFVTLQSGFKLYDCLTDEEGYFDLSNKLQQIEDFSEIQEIILTVGKQGYYYKEGSKHKNLWAKVYDKAFVQEGRQIVEDNIILNANGGMKGMVKNEYGDAIDAYVRFDENSSNPDIGQGQLTPTWSAIKGAFNIPAIPGPNRKLIIVPKDVAYFSDTLLVNVKEGASTLVENIVIKERSHRIYFYVKKAGNTSGGLSLFTPLAGARVKLLGDDNTPVAVADNNGKVELNFKNVSVNHHSLQVTGPNGSNFVPQIVNFKNEETKTPVKLADMVLKPGLSLKGIVTLDGKPTDKALVYIDLRKGIDTDYSVSDDGTSNSESQYYFQTWPKSDGSFELKCIPPELKGKQFEITAVYRIPKQFNVKGNAKSESETPTDSEGYTIIGDTKYVSIPSLGNLQLNMTSYKKMSITDIWGFPLKITKLEEQNGGNVRVSGTVKLSGFSKGFDPIGDVSYDVAGVVFAPGNQKVNGVPVGIPQQDKIVVNATRETKLKYAKSFNVKLKTKPNEGLLVIEKGSSSDNKSGKLSGLVHIVDNSFQYPSSYLNFDGTQFYFANRITTNNQGSTGNSGQIMTNNTAQLSTISPVIDLYNAAQPGNGSDTKEFNLCNVANENTGLASALQFKFINFSASAKPANSFISGKKITLDATLTATIENASQATINIGNLVLENNKIDPISSNQPIQVTLKDGASVYSADAKPWQIEAYDWVVDPQQGGLVSKKLHAAHRKT
jgi:TANFOR domain-containing protein